MKPAFGGVYGTGKVRISSVFRCRHAAKLRQRPVSGDRACEKMQFCPFYRQKTLDVVRK